MSLVDACRAGCDGTRARMPAEARGATDAVVTADRTHTAGPAAACSR